MEITKKCKLMPGSTVDIFVEEDTHMCILNLNGVQIIIVADNRESLDEILQVMGEHQDRIEKVGP